MENLSLSMLKDKDRFLKCQNCKECKGMRCSTGFIASMADITVKSKAEHSVYVIGNGIKLVENLEYKEYSKSLISSLIVSFLRECSSFTDINSAYLGLLACLKPIIGEVNDLQVVVPFDVFKIISQKDFELSREVQLKYKKSEDINNLGLMAI